MDEKEEAKSAETLELCGFPTSVHCASIRSSQSSRDQNITDENRKIGCKRYVFIGLNNSIFETEVIRY